MQCLDESVLQMFVEGLMSSPEDDIVRVHLSKCARCRLTVTQYKELMWDLEHLDEVELPHELAGMQQSLLKEWKGKQKEQKESARKRSLIPSWAGYTLLWPRYVPVVRSMGSFLSRTSALLVDSKLPLGRRRRSKGGGRG